MTITIKAKQFFGYGALLIIGLFVIAYAYWSFQSSQILTVNNSPVPVAPPEVKDGSKVYLTIDFCKKGDYVDKTNLYLIGETAGAKIAVSWPTGRTPEQCTVLREVPIPIPAQTPSDMYHAEFEVCYDINPIKKDRCTHFTSKSFKVVNDKLSPGDAQPVSP